MLFYNISFSNLGLDLCQAMTSNTTQIGLPLQPKQRWRRNRDDESVKLQRICIWSHHGTRKSSKRPQKRSRRPASRKEMQTEPGSTKLLKSNPQYEQIGIQHHKLQMTTRPRSFLSLLKTKTLHNPMEARQRQLILVLSITNAVGRKHQRKRQRKKQNPIFRKQLWQVQSICTEPRKRAKFPTEH